MVSVTPRPLFRQAAMALLLWLFQPAAARADLAIRNVTVIDVGGTPPFVGVNLIIRGNRIHSFGQNVPIPEGMKSIDGTGKYLIPGLWDMHVHLWEKESLFPLYLRYGVTAIRDMGSSLERVNQFRKENPRPIVITSGPPVDGPGTDDPKLPVYHVTNAEEARQAVADLKAKNVDFVKVLSGIPREGYIALMAEAKKERLAVAGHVPSAVGIRDTLDAGQASIEHLFGFLLACSSEERALSAELAKAAEKKDEKAYLRVRERIAATYSPKKASYIGIQFLLSGARLTPTLHYHRRAFQIGVEQMASDPRAKLVPESVRSQWKDPAAGAERYSKPAREALAAEYARLCQLVRELAAQGVPMLAGTDTGDDYVIPGLALHQELALMVEAGLPPLYALQTATINPAKLYDLKDMGTIAAGNRANLVLLEGNPLADIHNTERIAAVILDGVLVSQSE